MVPVLLQPDDPELKKQVKINKIAVESDLLGNIEEKYSCWLKIKQIIALVLIWRIGTEKREMLPTRSKKGIRFF